MGLHYGSKLDSMWSGVKPEELRAHWANELAGFQDMPEAIGHALDNLPESFPPTLGEFKKLCLSVPRKVAFELPPPKANDSFVASIFQKVKDAPKESDPKAWAYRLRARERACERLTAAQRTMWRAALNEDAGAQA